MKRSPVLLLAILLIACIGCIKYVDRLFFKRAHNFCAWFLFSERVADPQYDLPSLSLEQRELLDRLCVQKFTYLNKGNHCFAFLSEDGQYVIKFHRYPSSMRPLAWLVHPLRYHGSGKRKEIQDYNERRLSTHQLSYKNSGSDLVEETGLLLVHINPSTNLGKTLTLVDRSGCEVTVPLDRVTFLVQRRADLLYPTLKKFYKEGRLEEAKRVLSQVAQLIVSDYQKGYEDRDPALCKNYGLLSDRAIHIDVGDLVCAKGEKTEAGRLDYLHQVTFPLREMLKRECPGLLPYFEEVMDSSEKTL